MDFLRRTFSRRDARPPPLTQAEFQDRYEAMDQFRREMTNEGESPNTVYHYRCEDVQIGDRVQVKATGEVCVVVNLELEELPNGQNLWTCSLYDIFEKRVVPDVPISDVRVYSNQAQYRVILGDGVRLPCWKETSLSEFQEGKRQRV